MGLNTSPSWRESHKYKSEVFSDFQNEVQQDEERLQIIKEKIRHFLLRQQQKNSAQTDLTTSGNFAATHDLIVTVFLYGQIWEFGTACFMTVLQLKRAQFQNYKRLQIISHYKFDIFTFRRRLCYNTMACTWFVTNVYVCPFLINAKIWKGVIYIE
jgi:hypothetical protein